MIRHTFTVAFKSHRTTTSTCNKALPFLAKRHDAYSTKSSGSNNDSKNNGKQNKLHNVDEAQKELPELSTKILDEARKEMSELNIKEKPKKRLKYSKKQWVSDDNELMKKTFKKYGQPKSIAEKFANISRGEFKKTDIEFLSNKSSSANTRRKAKGTMRIDKGSSMQISTDELMKKYKKLADKKYEPKRLEELDMNEVSQIVDILMNSKERLNLFETTDRNSLSEQSIKEADYKTAIDWWDEWQSQLETEYKSHYQEILEWTREGKFPTLPVNNEIGMEEEQNIPFHKHVFLHEMLEDGIPKQGPVRKFMESVILGLSMNPHLTVQEKEEHINWFKEYFKEKYDLLKTLGTIGEENKLSVDKT